MEKKPNEKPREYLPSSVVEFIQQVCHKMRYRKKAAQDVQTELTAHFEDELRDCTDPQERQKKAQRLVEQFGGIQMLAVLCRRAKRRCRPLWATALVRTAQGAGVLLALFIVYTAWFMAGSPTPTVDYIAVLNQMSRPEIVERDNAWPHYEKAIGLLVGPDDEVRQMNAFQRRDRPQDRDFADLPQEARQAVEQWVQKNDSAWREFVAASATPYCQTRYACDPNAREPWLMNVLLPHLSPIRSLATVGVWRSRVELQRGEVPQALDDCLAVARAALHWQHREALVEQLVGLALSQMAHEEILGILHGRSLSSAELMALQRKIAELYSAQYPLIDIEGERLTILDAIQRVFTDKGPGGGHLAPFAASSLAVMGSHEDYPEVVSAPLLTALSMVHAGRNDTAAKANWMFDQQVKRSRLSPYERRTSAIVDADQMLASLPKYRYAVIHMLAPALDRVAELRFRGKALHEATLTVLALQRYRADKGGYPASLDELTQAGYLNTLPADPYSKGPLVYKATRDGFTLYSFGADFDDDNGRPSTDRKGRPHLWEDEGDAVFWPINP
ncbi:MAG: hypothetical protein A2Y77_08045 [Planctomycetes bacterium RBG_13_62_9]|nr:MAG: hypothetical protein A2Y77_08045 [Planctomycetes bacterium RBG_13_62_9]